MTGILLSLMGYHLWGERIHELLGVIFAIFLLLHNGLNLHWFEKLFQTEYTAFRILQVTINLLLLLVILSAIVSGIMLSQHLFPNLAIHNASDVVRKTHMASVHWGHLLISLHLGLHWKMLADFFCKILRLSPASLFANRVMPIIFSIIGFYGLSVFIHRDIASYLFLQTDFSFFDFEEPKILFYADFLAMTIFMAYLTRCLLWLFIFRNHAGKTSLR